MARSELMAMPERFDGTVAGWPGVTKKMIFGHPGYGVARKMFAFFDQGEVVVKLPGAEQEPFLARPGTRTWAPPGYDKPMGNWLGLSEQHYSEDELCDALELAYRTLAERELS